jgi:hypothetical protein
VAKANKVYEQADEIIAEIKAGRSQDSLTSKYHIGYRTLRKIILSKINPEEYAKIVKNKAKNARGVGGVMLNDPVAVEKRKDMFWGVGKKWWECKGCSAEYREKPESCIKCGGFAFEQIQRRHL